MRKIKFKDLPFIPAGHEDSKDPGALKKILFQKSDIPPKRQIQMINWGIILKGRHFAAHHHEDMDEIFIIISGRGRIYVGDEEDILEKGDAVLVPMGSVHKMDNISDEDINYLVIGLSLGKGGRTIIK